MEEINTSSNQFIKENHSVSSFHWQKGYGAFPYSRSDSNYVVKYIGNQEIQHLKTTFRQEHAKILNDFNVDYKEEYLLILKKT